MKITSLPTVKSPSLTVFACAALVFSAYASVVEIEYVMPGGRVERELRAKPAKIEVFDVFGRSQGNIESQSGLVRLPIPASGYAVVKFTDNEGKCR